MSKYPILYSENETDFFGLGLGPMTNTLKATVSEERNGSFIFEAEVLVDDVIYPLIQENGIIKADAGHKLKNQRFRIKRILPNSKGKAEIYAEHVSYLAAELSIKPEASISGSGSAAMALWKSQIVEENPFEVYSNISTQTSTHWRIDKVQNPRQALGGVEGSILDRWGGEYKFDNYLISLLEKRGTTAETVLAYGRNITDFEQERNISETYTSVYPYAIYSDDKQVEHLVTIPGYVVDCENVSDYPNRNTLPVDFSSEFDHDTKPTADELKKLATDYIKNNQIGVPKVSIKVSFLDLSKTADYKDYAPLEEVDLCDEVFVYYEKLGVNTTAKVIRTVWNVLSESYDEIEIGSKRVTLSSIIKDQQTQINEVSSQSNSAIVAANGKNMIFYGLFGEDGLDEPTATKVGDMWYKPNGDETEFYIWDGTDWGFVMSTGAISEAVEAAEKAQEESAQALKDANTAVDKANQAVAEAGFANTAAQTAIEQSANAVAQAQDAQKQAADLLSSVTDLQGSLTTVESVVDELNGQLALKVSQVDFDKLAGTVDSHTTQITANAKEISLKADSSVVDTLKGTVDSNSAQLGVQSTQISGLVSKTDGLDTSLAQLQVEAGSIKTSVANVQNQVDGIQVGGRNYVKNSQFVDDLANWSRTANVNSKVASPFIEISPAVVSDYVGIQQVFNINLSAGDVITVSMDAYNLDATSEGMQIGMHWRDSTGILAQSWTDITNSSTTRIPLTNTIKRYSFTYKVPTGVTATSVNLMVYGARGKIFNIAVGNIKFEKGNKATDHSLASEDQVTVTEFSSFEQTVKGFQTTVNNQISGLQTQQTTLAGQYTSVISQINEWEAGWNNLHPDTSNEFKTVTFSGWNYYPLGTTFSMSILPNSDYTARVYYDAVVGDMMTIRVFWVLNTGALSESPNGTLIRTGQSGYATITQKAPANAVSARVVLRRTTNAGSQTVTYKELKFEKGSTATPWTAAPSGLATQSQITQLVDDINLRVQKGDVINQINISTESILIAGNKVHITGQTTIDSGVITNAMIANAAINAAKIQDATISSAKIISIDANKISTGSLIGVNIKSASNGSLFEVQGNYLQMTKANGEYLTMDTSGIYWKNASGAITFQSTKKMTTSDIFGTATYNVYLAAGSQAGGGESRSVTQDTALTGSGTISDYWYVPHRAEGFYGNFLEVNSTATNMGTFNNVYVRPTGEGFLKVTTRQSTSTFRPIQSGAYFLNDSTSVGMDRGGTYVRVGHIAGKYESISLGDDGSPRVGFKDVYNRTYSQAANACITSSNTLGRITSASKYKLNISVLQNAEDLGQRLLTINPKSWYDKNQTELFADELTNGVTDCEDALVIKQRNGLIAEDLRDAGLEAYISYDELTGEIEGIEYDRLWTVLIPVIRRHQEELAEQKSINLKLQTQIDELKGGAA